MMRPTEVTNEKENAAIEIKELKQIAETELLKSLTAEGVSKVETEEGLPKLLRTASSEIYLSVGLKVKK